MHCANGLPFTLARRAISIDGSGGKDGAPASWAAIVLANDGHMRLKPYTAFAGWVLGPQQSQSVGTVSCNSTPAEGAALAWTLLWVIAISRGLPVSIVYDAIVGIDVAQGHASWHADANLSFVVRALSFIAATQTCFCFQHAPAHSGYPWNALADVVVDYFCKTRLPGAPSGASSDMLGNILNSSWVWMLFLSSEQGFSLPAVIDGCLAVAPPCNVLERTTPSLSYSKQVPVLLAAMIINLRLVTLNVFTVQENYKGQIAAAGPFQAGRGDFIRPQCFHAGFLIVGGQEGRLPQGTVSSEHYICVNSGASNGCYGNFLWIATYIPYATAQDKLLCFFLWNMYMLFLLHRAVWQLLPLLGIAVSWLWCYTAPFPKPNLRFVRLSAMMLHLSYSPVCARPDACLSSLTSVALLRSLLRLALVLVVTLPLRTLVESCLPTSWSAGSFVLLLP